MIAIMTPAGCRLSDICATRRHYAVQTCIAIKKKLKQSSKSAKGVDSPLTPLSANLTAASSLKETGYCSRDEGQREQSSVSVSPTVPWTNINDDSQAVASTGQQLPVYRRSCDSKLQGASLPGKLLPKGNESHTDDKSTNTDKDI